MIGGRVIAPEGFLCLSKGAVYHFLQSDSARNRVRLILFADDGNDVSAQLVTISAVEFEEALENDLLICDNSSGIYPPWLEPVQGVAIPHLESLRRSKKESYDQKVDRRYMAIAELVSRFLEILASDNPNAIINAHAKSQRPQQNAGRLRFWFYSYIIFGHNKWALLPKFHRIGGWNRGDPSRVRKLGRPSSKGRKFGYPVTADMKEKILSGFLKFKSSYKTQESLYNVVLTREFKCVVHIKKDGTRVFGHPEGQPFPSQVQFKYWLKKMISPDALARELKGAHKKRAQSGSQGSFSERLTNVNQRVEFDGYYISEKLTGLTEGSAVDSFCVVRAVCGLSGAVVGIGFSEGKENMAAYRMALFSMAVDKVRFGELFGMEIKPGEWPCVGLSGGVVFDRGPGAGLKCEPEINWLGSFELTPVYSGQSKATVESSHPRDKKSFEQPTYFHSKLNFVEMAKREIFQVLWDNHTSDAGRRMSEEMLLTGFKPTPHNIWNYLDSRCRNSSIGMPFDTAVRTFLTQHSAMIQKDAVYFYGRKYRSQALMNTRVFDRVARNGAIKITAFAMTMCVRHIWVEVEGVLFELDIVRSASTLPGSIDISLQDLKEIDTMRRAGAAALREERPAMQQEYIDRFNRNTGEEWGSGVRKLGRAGKGAPAQRDIADYNRFRGQRNE
ncbi:transposase [Pseudomonas moorei]|nr:transposase [Pseudomonas moorei]